MKHNTKPLLIVYSSLTNQGKRYCRKLGYLMKDINDFQNAEPDPAYDYLIETRSVDFGEVPNEVLDFLDDYAEQLNIIGTIACGNRNWGENFGKAGEVIAVQYGIPCLQKFELAGFPDEETALKQQLHAMGYTVDTASYRQYLTDNGWAKLWDAVNQVITTKGTTPNVQEINQMARHIH